MTELSDFVTEINRDLLLPRDKANCKKGARRVRDIFGMSKKRYSTPALRNLTPEQAKKIIADGKNCSEEEAAAFLESLQRQEPQNDEKRNEPLKDNWEQNKKRSA